MRNQCRATGTVRVRTPTSRPEPCAKGWEPIITACEALGTNVSEHIENYGAGIKDRLTGAHETAHWSQFSYGASDRGASVRIPWIAAKERKGWLEDRRPNANMDPYTVTRLIVETCCGALAAADALANNVAQTAKLLAAAR